ncbi:MAG: glycosyltransferase family 2 protein [Oscillospiraceae bacterium]|nr:glycosyltransferase [Oscillospiraceae bacterium]MDY3064974.1 glycosyltransferase family 2 protein [Oscillospiraceae bacterium]
MRFSFIMPVYQCEKYLVTSIQSVMSQTYFDWELILIDDGSTDSSPAICDAFAEKDARIHVLHQNNKGPSAARNEGLKAAVGEYVLFIDSDDIFESDALSILCEQITSAPELVVFSYVQDNWKDGERTQLFERILPQSGVIDATAFCDIYTILSGGYFINPVWNKAYNRAFLRKIEALFPDGISASEDLVFNMQVFSQMKKVVLCDKALYHYTVHGDDSLCGRFRSSRFADVQYVYEKVRDALAVWNPDALPQWRNQFLLDISVTVNSLYFSNCDWSYRKKRIYVREIVRNDIVRDCTRKVKVKRMRTFVVKLLVQMKAANMLLLTGKMSRILKKRKG